MKNKPFRISVSVEAKERFEKICKKKNVKMNKMFRSFLKTFYHDDKINNGITQNFIFDHLGHISANRVKGRYTESICITNDPAVYFPELFEYLESISASKTGFCRACIFEIINSEF